MVKKPNVLLCKRSFDDPTLCMHESATDLEGGEVECNDCKKIFQIVDINPDQAKHEIEDLDLIIDNVKYRLPLIGNKEKQAKLYTAIQKFSRWISIMKKEVPELCLTVETMVQQEQNKED